LFLKKDLRKEENGRKPNGEWGELKKLQTQVPRKFKETVKGLMYWKLVERRVKSLNHMGDPLRE